MSLRIKYNTENISSIFLTLQEEADYKLISGMTYTLKLEQNGYLYECEMIDISDAPDIYNHFNITTLISSGSTDNNIPLEFEGWYDYIVTNNLINKNLLEWGSCYVVDNDGVENIINNTTTYQSNRTKIVYKK